MNLQYTYVMYPVRDEPQTCKPMDIKTIRDVISRYFGIADISVRSRKPEIVYARHMHCFFSRKRTFVTDKNIGASIGYRDRSTVIHSVKTLQNWYDTDENVRMDVMRIENIFSRRAGGVTYSFGAALFSN